MTQESPKNPGHIVPRETKKLAEQAPDLPYGKEWQEIAGVVSDFTRLVDANRDASPACDVAVGKAVGALLTEMVKRDRMAYIHKDLDTIEKNKQLSDEEHKTHIQAVIQQYGITTEEGKTIANHRIFRRFEPLPTPQIKARDEFRPERKNCTLYHFAGVTIERTEENGVSVNLHGVYDGGINSIAYPLKETTITAKPEQPIDVNFGNIDLHRITPLARELQEHPDIIAAIKTQFADIVRQYTTNDCAFIAQRKPDGRDDSTQLYGFLCDFITKTYLPSKLRPETVETFNHSRRHIDSPAPTAALRLRVLNEQLVNPKAYLRTNPSHQEHAAYTITTANNSAQELMRSLGGRFSETGELQNLQELIQQALTNPQVAKRVNTVWEQICNLDEREYVLSRELKPWEGNYRWDLEMNLFQRALEMARGVITVEPTVTADLIK